MGRFSAWLLREVARPVWGQSRVIHQVPDVPRALQLVRQHDVHQILWRPAAEGRTWSLERQLVKVEPDLPGGGVSLHAEIPAGQRFLGAGGLRLGGLALTELNRGTGTPERVRAALEWLDQFGNPFDPDPGPEEAGTTLAPRRGETRPAALRFPNLLADLDPAVRLALEMASHEAEERLFLKGELWHLERAWREAAEVAAIADKLLVPT